MALPPPDDTPRPGAPDWLVTFGDLMSLLLTFFILLLSFSTMEISKFNTLSGSIRSAFGLKSPLAIQDRPSGSDLFRSKSPADVNRKGAKQKILVVKLREVLEKAGLSDLGSVQVIEEGVALRIEGDALFDSGDASLKPGVLPVLDRLVEIATREAGELRVEGHTDDVPIATPRYPSNWELSAARAGSAVRYMSSNGVPPNRMMAVGLADSRPVASNDTPADRAKNRRIEFVFLKSDPDRTE